MSTQQPPSGSDALNHPRPEEWMAYLYDEISSGEKNKLAAHLDHCASCRGQVAQWRDSMRALDLGKAAAPRFRIPQPVLKWAVAATLMIGLGFGLGHFIYPNNAWQTSLKSELRAELLAELKKEQSRQLADYKSMVDLAAENNQAMFNAVLQVADDQKNNYDSLHKELETVAVLTQDNLRRQGQAITTLAAISQPNAKDSLNQ